jgi:hypothetical protein
MSGRDQGGRVRDRGDAPPPRILLDEYHAGNEPKIHRLFTFYRLATIALLGEVIFWSLQLALS